MEAFRVLKEFQGPKILQIRQFSDHKIHNIEEYLLSESYLANFRALKLSNLANFSALKYFYLAKTSGPYTPPIWTALASNLAMEIQSWCKNYYQNVYSSAHRLLTANFQYVLESWMRQLSELYWTKSVSCPQAEIFTITNQPLNKCKSKTSSKLKFVFIFAQFFFARGGLRVGSFKRT